MADLTFLNVSKSFNGLPVLENFSYTFREGERYCLMGPSGCGKTTLLRLACGLTNPDAGTISGGMGKCAYVFQEDRLLPWYTVRQNIALVCRRKDADFWIKAVGLDGFADALPTALSGGMRRRAAIARALAADGDFYLFDEAFTGLDTDAKASLYNIVLTHTADKLCLFTSHDPAEAAAVKAICVHLPGKSMYPAE